jgi:hypothetical protein
MGHPLYNKAFEEYCHRYSLPASYIKNDWQHVGKPKQQENAFEIARQAGALW